MRERSYLLSMGGILPSYHGVWLYLHWNTPGMLGLWHRTPTKASAERNTRVQEGAHFHHDLLSWHLGKCHA